MTKRTAAAKDNQPNPPEPTPVEQPKQLTDGGVSPQQSVAQSLTKKFGITLDSRGNPDLPSLGFILQQSGFFPDIEKASQGMVKVMLGKELGFPAITAVIGIHILKDKDGKVTVMIGSHLKAGKIKSHPRYDYDVEEQTDQRCTLIPMVRSDDGTWEKKKPVTFTIEQAQKMKLGGWGKDGPKFNAYGNWAKAPEDMLFNRCIGRMEKMHFPDLSTVPTSTPDEAGFREDERGEPVIVDGHFVRDEDDARVPTEPTKTAPEKVQEARAKASGIVVAKLAAISRDKGWNEEQFFQMLSAEDAATDVDALKIAIDSTNWKNAQELIAGDEATVAKVEALLAMGPDGYLDFKNNPPPEQGSLLK